jgi:hypothetical protein
MTTLHPWNSKGVLDPISAPLAMNRAPYLITLPQLVERFGQTAERRKILRGFFAYRAGLRDLKIAKGFQWIDGSFVEEIEVLEGRPPGDIDVVTFYHLPEDETQKSILAQAPEYFPADEEEKKVLKDRFSVDTMMSCLDVTVTRLVKQAVFFYSVWSHRRDYTWKGFIQVDLAATEDAVAIARLDELDAQDESDLAVEMDLAVIPEHKDEI